MGLVRVVLTVFALANAAVWAFMALIWSWKPAWIGRLPLPLGLAAALQQSLRAAPAWARFGSALSGFWITAAGLYAVQGMSSGSAPVVVLFVIASIYLLIGIMAGGAVFRALTVFGDGSAPAAKTGEQPL